MFHVILHLSKHNDLTHFIHNLVIGSFIWFVESYFVKYRASQKDLFLRIQLDLVSELVTETRNNSKYMKIMKFCSYRSSKYQTNWKSFVRNANTQLNCTQFWSSSSCPHQLEIHHAYFKMYSIFTYGLTKMIISFNH